MTAHLSTRADRVAAVGCDYAGVTVEAYQTRATLVAIEEARRILDTEEPSGLYARSGQYRTQEYLGAAEAALADALAEVTRDGGPLDELAAATLS